MNWIFNKRVLLTGASSGIGKDIAKVLIGKYNCTILGISRSQENLQKCKQEMGENFSFYAMDTSKLENWQKLQEKLIADNMQIDILINNAGRMHNFTSIENLDFATIENVLNVNFYSSIYSIKTLLPMLKQNKGAIINVNSSSALCAIAGTSAYCASKGALKSFMEAITIELKGKVFVGTYYPGFTKTNLFDSKDNASPIISAGDRKITNALSMNSDKMAKKIVRCIKRKKRRKILGIDAKAMNLLYKFMPKYATGIINKVLVGSKRESFKDINS